MNVKIVDSIDLETAGGARATINFTYDKFDGTSTDGPISSIVRPCEAATTAQARFLTRIDLPANEHGIESYRFDYFHPSDPATDCELRGQSGTLTRATLPTGGHLDWSYQTYPLTESYTSMGVKERIAYDAGDHKLQHTVYQAGQGTIVQTLAPGANANDPWQVSYKTNNYFWYGNGREFGLPFDTTPVSGIPNPDTPDLVRKRYLSTVIYDCTRSADCSAPTRATYVAYEMDYVKEGQGGCTPDQPCFRDRNRRVVSESTLYAADGGKFADTEYSAFDGLGHYRNADIGDYYTSHSARQSKRETYTSFNPSVGIYAVDANLQRIGTYSALSAAAPWILGTYDFTRAHEGNRYAVTEACFEAATGYILRSRVLGRGVYQSQSEVPPQPSVFRTNTDLLAVFEKDDVTNTGWDKTQTFYGGDAQPSIGTDPICSIALPSSSQYQLNYTYENGGLKTTRYSGTPSTFYTVDQTIDKSTGMAVESRDTAGALTTFGYDASGRLKSVTPPGGAAPTSYDYVPVAGTLPARITVVTGSLSAENHLEQQYEYDGLGRLTREKRLMPGGGSSTRETLYDFAGRRASVSEWGNTAAKTTFSGYDAFGRAAAVTAPDGATTSFAYDGVWKTTRTVGVATSASGSTPVSAIEESDRLGRLISVTEGVTSSSAGQKTDYTYRIGDQLATVFMQDGGTSTQSRTFTYDGRNLLQSEQHPESGTIEYKYDARGHIIGETKPLWQLTFEYDRAERLRNVFAASLSSPTVTKTLKSYDYADALPNLGRLIGQTRRNYVASGEYDVADAFDYDTAGRVSQKTTTITHGSEQSTFAQTYDYTDLGQPLKLHFPTCTGCGTFNVADRALPLAYKAGLLTGIGALTYGSGITYTNAGQVYQVQHAALNGNTPVAGVLDTYESDASGMPRPGRIKFTGANDCNLILGQSNLNVSLDEGAQATFSVTAAANTTFAWYKGTRGSATATLVPGETQSAFTTPALTESTYYFCRVTASGVCSQDSPTFTATICKPARISSPDSFAGAAETIESDKSLYMDVVATGTTVNYLWQRAKVELVNGAWTPAEPVTGSIGTSHDYTFTATSADEGKTYGFYMTVSGSCGISSPRLLVRVVSVAAPTAPCPKPTVFSSFPAELWSSPTQPVTLSVAVEDTNAIGLESNENLYYRWTVNGHLLPTNPPTYTTYAHTPESVTVEVARKCGADLSPSVKLSTFIYDGAHCPLPMFTVDQTAIRFDPNNSAHNKFTVTSPWPSLTFEWLRGDRNSGQVLGTGREFTPQFPVGTLFVRATSQCGTVAESQLLTVSFNDCLPMQFTRPPQSADVKAKTRYVLTYDTNLAPVTTIWYEGVKPNHHEIARTRNLTLDPPQPLKTTKYWVYADGGCSYAESPVATLHVTSCDDITVVQQPQSASINEGQTAQLQITATSAATLSYQWYLGESGDDSHRIDGQTLPSYLAQPAVTTNYWVRTSIAGGCEIDSPTVTVHVCRTPVVSQQPIEYTSLMPSYWFRLNAHATGDSLSYQWYIGEVGDTSAPLGVKESTIIVTPPETTKYWFRAISDCFDTTPDAHADSGQVRVSVCPRITEQPAAQYPETMAGATATITIAADRGDVIEWHRRNADNSSSGVLGTGAVLHPVVNDTTTFYAVVKSGTCTVESEPVTVGICTKPKISWAGTPKTKIATGEWQILSVIGTWSGVYENACTWYVGNSGDVAGSTIINGPGNQIVQQSIAPTVTTKYWVRIKETSGCYDDTPTLTVEVCVPTIRTQPASVVLDKVANPAATATLSVTADGGVLAYQWYIGQPGDVSNPLSGQTGSSLTVSPSADATYWVRVSGSCGISKDSAPAAVTLCKVPQINTLPPSTSSTANAPLTLTVYASGTDLTYQWYAGASGVTTTPLGTSASQAVSPAATTDYWVKVSGRCGASVNSSTIKVSIPPAITTQPASGQVMPGTSRTLTVAATGPQLSYQWYGANLIPNATSASYTTPALNADATYWVRVFSGNAYTDSAPAALSVCTQPTIAWNAAQTQITQGQSQNLSVSATVANQGNGTFTWYSGTDSGIVAGATVVNSGQIVQYATPALTATTKYWVRIMEGSVCYADTPTLIIQVCVPTITAHPQPIMINSGASTTLSVTANGGPLTYQWYIGAAGDMSNPISGQTSPALTVSPAVDTTYWVRVSGSCGQTRNSNAATVTICKTPQITAHPQNVNLIQPGFATVGVSATGTNLTYQWYAGTSPNTATPVGGTSANFTVQVNGTSDYWVKVSGSCGSPANSNTVKISVPPTISTQPASAAVTKGTTRTLTVAANGGQLSYQWYSGASALITGATAASFTTPPLNADISYFARVYSGNAYTDSATAALTVCQPRSAVIVSNPAVSGSSVTLRVDTSDGSETYEWYRGESGVTTTVVGFGAQITMTNVTATGRYWVRTKRATCDADSAAITVSICIPAITTQPQGGTINSGSTKTLTVAANGTAPLSYQWYVGASGTTTNPVSGATSATFTTPALTTTTTYWCQVKSPADSNCSGTAVNSVAATVTVCQQPAVTQNPQNVNLPFSTSSVTLNVSATGVGLSYQWYEGAAGVTTTPVGTNSSSLTRTPGTTKSYWVRVTGTCGTADSTAALVSVTPNIVSQPPNQTVCQSSTQTFTVGATGSPLSYQWFKATAGSGGWQAVGTDSPSLTLVIAVETSLMCTVRSGNATKDTWPVTVSITPGPTIYGIGRQYMYSNWYRLTVSLENTDVKYAWYRGALGDTSQRIGGDLDSEAWIQATTSTPVWVRVTSNETGCFSDASTVVP